jgi:hypothetical protein
MLSSSIPLYLTQRIEAGIVQSAVALLLLGTCAVVIYTLGTHWTWWQLVLLSVGTALFWMYAHHTGIPTVLNHVHPKST